MARRSQAAAVLDIGRAARRPDSGESLDGGPYASFALYAVAGLATAYEVDLDALLGDEGRERVRRVEGECVGDSLPKDAFTRSTTLTRDGRPLVASFDEEPWRSILGDNVIGERRPATPVLLTHSLPDDVIPYAVGLGLARRWCGLGTTVRFSTTAVPTHVGGAVPNFAEEYAFLEARLAGVPATSTCSQL